MRAVLPQRLEQGRTHGNPSWGPYGAFALQGPCGERLRIVASGADEEDVASQGWEHVSVSTRRRCPNWQEMSFVKDLFWDEEECVVQFHPPKSDYVNNHPYVLHLWKATKAEFPRPPSILVGRNDLGILTADEARRVKAQMDREAGL